MRASLQGMNASSANHSDISTVQIRAKLYWKRRLLLPFVGLPLLGVALFHLAMLTLYNSPNNALRIKYFPTVESYVNPLFYQTWSFFAPNPIDQSSFALTRGRLRNGWTPWINVSMYLIKQMRANRLSADELLLTSVSNAVLVGGRELTKSRNLRTPSELMKDGAFRLLIRTSASALQQRYPGSNIQVLQLALSYTVFPRFSHRFETKDKDSAWVESPLIPMPLVDASPW